MQAETAMRTPARHRVQRTRQRASYEREAIHAILDAGMLAHVGFCIDAQPFRHPDALRARRRRRAAARLDRQPADEPARRRHPRLPERDARGRARARARSHFHHSVNYRSVVAFGRATLVEDPVHKAAALAHFVDALIPGRAAESRPADRNELAATRVLRLEIEDASAKVRDGGVKEDAADLALPYWAGVVPIRTQHAAAQPDASAGDMGLPASVLALLAQGARA